MAGYSSKSLSEKLGIREGTRVLIVEAPADYEVKSTTDITENLDLIQFFTAKRVQLDTMFPRLVKMITSSGSIWISWPKKAAKVNTDLDENIVREIGLSNGVVDVKVIAVDEIWSGLKFVFRLQDRKKAV